MNPLKTLLILPAILGAALLGAGEITQWDTPRRGVMISEKITPDDLAVLNSWNVNLVRWQLRWKDFPKSPADTSDAETYDKWLNEALDHFDAQLPLLEKYGIKVVLDLHTPPGGRGEDAVCRIFTDPAFAQQFQQVWKRIAQRYRSNPNIIGYDLLNEPVIPKTPAAGIKPWRQQSSEAIRAIRAIDPAMPVIFENHQWAIPNTFDNFHPLPFQDVIYSIHFYYPYEVAFQGLNGSPNGIHYPGTVNGEIWNRQRLENVLEGVIELQKKHAIRIYVGEFSCIRWAPGETRENLLSDMIGIFESHNWPWTYHAFREWSGWSVEHSGDSANPDPAPVPTASQQLLLKHFAENRKD